MLIARLSILIARNGATLQERAAQSGAIHRNIINSGKGGNAARRRWRVEYAKVSHSTNTIHTLRPN